LVYDQQKQVPTKLSKNANPSHLVAIETTAPPPPRLASPRGVEGPPLLPNISLTQAIAMTSHVSVYYKQMLSVSVQCAQTHRRVCAVQHTSVDTTLSATFPPPTSHKYRLQCVQTARTAKGVCTFKRNFIMSADDSIFQDAGYQNLNCVPEEHKVCTPPSILALKVKGQSQRSRSKVTGKL